MQNPLLQTIEALAKEKGIEADTIITAIEDAVLTASRKYYKTNEELKTERRMCLLTNNQARSDCDVQKEEACLQPGA